MDKPSFIDLTLHEDDRGSVYCIFDKIGDFGIKRAYMVENFSRGQIRAFHSHMLGDTYLHCVAGSVKCVGLNTQNLNDYVVGILSARKPRLFKVPKMWSNGAMSLTDGTKLLVLSTLTFEEAKQDDSRLPWDIVPGLWDIKNR